MIGPNNMGMVQQLHKTRFAPGVLSFVWILSGRVQDDFDGHAAARGGFLMAEIYCTK
jgi:hypothetical protein